MRIQRITCGNVRPSGRISAGSVHDLEKVETATITIIEGTPYEGETDVIPKTIAQMLPTKDTLVKTDITVEAIPYYTTTNPSGGYTAIIGG